MRPKLNAGDFVFCSLTNSEELYSSIPRDRVIMEFKEREGITLILDKNDADKFCLKYDYVAAWLTLEIHSALDAGLTGSFEFLGSRGYFSERGCCIPS